MVGTKYLSQVMQEVLKGGELGSNTLIVSPVGSGKTHYIFEDLCKHAKTLYLCDTTNLKNNVINEYPLHTKIGGDKTTFLNIEVMCYAEFGKRIEKDVNMINNYDYIIADEVHNLIDYERMGRDVKLVLAAQALIQQYTNTKVVWLTATPLYLEITNKKFPHFTDNFVIYDFVKNARKYDIRRYENRSIRYINHYSDVKTYLTSYLSAFNNFGEKCLVFTQFIDTMQNIESICTDLGLKPICIWSDNNADNPMSVTQRVVKEHLLETGCLKEPYNVLIINRATESGVNIRDPKIQLMICNTKNEVQQVQARGRIRHDIDLLVLKTDNQELLQFSIDDEILGLWLTKESVIERVIVKNNLRNEHGRQIGIKTLPDILEKFGYKLEAKRRTKKKITMYQITKL